MKMFWSTLLIVLLGAVPGFAVLGNYTSSIDLDQSIYRSEQRSIARQGYTVYELTSPNGLVVKEFVSQAGFVFGVTWRAPQMPDLQQLLGENNMTVLRQALTPRTRHRTGGPLVLRTTKLVFVSGGHMRNFHGYAFVPSMVPANFRVGVMNETQD